MASTGLLGINPYRKGVDLDFSAKPVNLYINLMQQDAARRDALDKYFMDYEKSLDPSGMRPQDKDVFLKKLAETKDFYIKNRDKILNPAKYGAEAQSQLMAGYKNVLSSIGQSKQRAAEDRVLAPLVIDARKNQKVIPSDVLTALERNKLSIGDPNHVGFDPLNFDAYDQHDPLKFATNIYSKIKPSEGPAQKVWNKSIGDYEILINKDYNKDAIAPLRMGVVSELRKDRGLQDQVKAVMSDPNQLAQVAQAYQKFTGVPMNNTVEDIALGYTIALKPPPVTDRKDYNNWKEKIIWEQNYNDQLARKAVQGIGTGIVKSAFNNPREVINNGVKEKWFDLNLPVEVTKDFTVPGTQRVWVKNTDFNPNDPNSQEFISKPTDRQTQLPVSNLTVRNGKIYGFIKPVDANGNPVSGKADEIEISRKLLASKIHKATGATDSKTASGIDQIDKELEQGLKQILPQNAPQKYIIYKGKKYSPAQVDKAAKASGMTVDEYIKSLK